MSKVFNIIFDEGHCITQWGSSFRLEYKLVGVLRFIAPRGGWNCKKGTGVDFFELPSELGLPNYVSGCLPIYGNGVSIYVYISDLCI